MTRVKTKSSFQKILNIHFKKVIIFTKKRWGTFAFYFIFLLSFFPRLAELLNNHDYFGYEQGIDMLITKGIIIDHIFPLIGYEVGGIGGFSKGPGWNYLMAIPFMLSNGDPFSERILMFILSFLTVLLAFFLFKKLLGTSTAFFISLFLAISPSLISHAGIIWPPLALPFITIIFLYFLYRVFRKEVQFLPLIYFLIGVMVHFEVATAGILFIELSIVTSCLYFKKILSFHIVIFSILLFTLAISPILLFDFQNNFSNTKGLLALIFTHSKTPDIPIDYLEYILQRLDNYFWNFRHTFSPNISLSLIFIFLIILSTFTYLNDRINTKPKKILILFLTTNPLVSFVILLLYKGAISEWWLIYQIVFYCVTAGILVSYFIKKKSTKLPSLFLLILFLTLFIYKTSVSISKIFLTIKDENVIKRAIPINYIYNNSHNEKFAIEIIAPRKNTQEYKYLIWLKEYRTKKHQSSNPKYKYLIIERAEKDLSKKIKIIKNMSGKNIHQIKFENGIYIVQKYQLTL